MMKNFAMTSAVIIISFTVLGSILFWQVYRYTLLEKKSSFEIDCLTLAGVTERYLDDRYTDIKNYANDLKDYALARSIAILVVYPDGSVWLATDGGGIGANLTTNINAQIVQTAMTDSGYYGIGNFGGFFNETVFALGKPVYDRGSRARMAVFVVSQMSGITRFYYDIIRMFIITAAGVLLAAFAVSYAAAQRMTTPLKRMRDAARLFARGDFGMRVEVSGRDEIAELAAAFNHMASGMQKLEQMRSDFIANISHELKTPMTTIAGFVEGILDGTIPPESQSHYLRTISSETRRLSRLVSRILFVSRLQSGTQELMRSRADICEIISRVALGFEQAVSDKNLTVEINYESQPIFADIDVDAITQVVYNLFDNAVKYSEKSGLVRITAANRNGKPFVSIYNTGKGIPEGDLIYVFERFYKADRSRGMDKDSFGLGLFIVKAILNGHGEDIAVSSREGEYAEFSFTLPPV